MNKRAITAGIVFAVVILVFSFVFILPKLHKGTTNLNMTGGGPSFGKTNEVMADFNKTLKYKVTVVDEEHVTDHEDMSNVDLVQGGSLSATDVLRARGDVKITAEMVMATSPNMLFVKSNANQDEYGPLVAAGFIQVSTDGVNTMTPEKFAILLNGELNDLTYEQVGVTGLNKKIRIGFPNSSGGRTSVAQMLACTFNECNMITPEQFATDPRYLDALQKFYVKAGKQPLSTYSVDYCKNWLNSANNAVTLAIFPESCYGTWRLEQTTDDQKKRGDDKGNIGVYLTKTVVQQFTLVGTSDPGALYIKTIQDPTVRDQFATALTESTGMRGSGSMNVPPTSLASWVASNEPWEPMEFPFTDLTDAIKKALKSYGG